MIKTETKPNHQQILSKYISRVKDFRKELQAARQRSRGLSTLRLLTFLAAAGALAYGYYGPMSGLYLLAAAISALFLYLIVRHARLNDEIAFLEKLIKINEKSVSRLQGEWHTFADDGSQYVDHSHPYSTDLHIFGKGSLFQYIFAPLSFGGEKVLVDLLRAHPSFAEIAPRQEAVADLAARLDFRQNMQATATNSFFRSKDPKEIWVWLEKELPSRSLPQIVFVLPIVTLALLVLAYLGHISYVLPLSTLFAQALLALWGERVVAAVFADLDKPVTRLKRYAELLRWIEAEDFTAPFLLAQKEKLFSKGIPSSQLIRQLLRIAERNDLRYSNALLYYPLNIALFWDLWTLSKLEDWQKSWGYSVKEWLQTIAQIEAISCISGLHHDNPQWVFPSINDGAPFIETKEIAHPLIPADERIGNDVSMPKQGRVLMITGSNMSGKSTLLRTVGINLVMAYAGAPVCATGMSCSAMKVFCKMQIHDNLKERVSTFYAELQRMKMIIDGAKSNEPLLVLLDEIFRGTNSRDRITATRTVIRQLHQLNTITMVTTHDLELGALADEYPGTICNYHFTDDIRNDHISFDYKLKPGISKTANAIALMKMIGIEGDVSLKIGKS